MGKDWCLLAVQLGMADRVPKLEGTRGRGQSQTAKLMDEWERNGEGRNTIGKVIVFDCILLYLLLHSTYHVTLMLVLSFFGTLHRSKP